jgi:hypothetical protein
MRWVMVVAVLAVVLGACGDPAAGLEAGEEAEDQVAEEQAEEQAGEEDGEETAEIGEEAGEKTGEGALPGTERYAAGSLEELGGYLEGLPVNSRETAYRAALNGVDLSRLAEPETAGVPDGFKPFYDALRGRYAALDLDACTGATLAYYDRMQQDFSQRRDRDKIVSLVLPAATTRVGFRAFERCTSLVSVVMPAGLRSIGQYAFAGCTSLERVELPATLTGIDFAAFQGCTSLVSVVVHAETPPNMLSGGIDNWFGDVSRDFVIYVPEESVEEYKKAEGWSRYAEKIRFIGARHLFGGERG